MCTQHAAMKVEGSGVKEFEFFKDFCCLPPCCQVPSVFLSQEMVLLQAPDMA